MKRNSALKKRDDLINQIGISKEHFDSCVKEINKILDSYSKFEYFTQRKILFFRDVLSPVLMKDQNIKNYTFIEDYDKDNWDILELKNKFPHVFGKTPSGRILNHSEISLLLKHYHIILDLYNSDNSHALVLEDDVVFCDNFLDELENCLS